MLNDLLVYVKEVQVKGRTTFPTKNIEKGTAVIIGRSIESLFECTYGHAFLNR